MPIDFFQVALVVVVIILTALLTVLGIEVFYILKDIRRIIDRVHNVLGDAEQVVSNVKKPTEVLSSLSHSAEILTKLFEVVKNHEDNGKPKQEEVVRQEKATVVFEEPIVRESPRPKPREEAPTQPISLGRRFFRMPRRPVS